MFIGATSTNLTEGGLHTKRMISQMRPPRIGMIEISNCMTTQFVYDMNRRVYWVKNQNPRAYQKTPHFIQTTLTNLTEVCTQSGWSHRRGLPEFGWFISRTEIQNCMTTQIVHEDTKQICLLGPKSEGWPTSYYGTTNWSEVCKHSKSIPHELISKD